MKISAEQDKAKLDFQRMVNELIESGFTPLTIARAISGGDESFVKRYRPAIAQKIASGQSLPNWVVGTKIIELHEKHILNKN